MHAMKDATSRMNDRNGGAKSANQPLKGAMTTTKNPLLPSRGVKLSAREDKAVPERVGGCYAHLTR